MKLLTMKNKMFLSFLILGISIFIYQPLYAQERICNINFNKDLKILNSLEWKMLFNGKDLEGWEIRGGKALFTIENNVITGTAVDNTPSTYLCAKKNYSDFILEVEFKVDRWMNSGIQIRSHSKPDYRNGEVFGYQVEIDPSERLWSGGIFDQSRNGWIYSLKDNEKARNAFQADSWNHFRIEAIGPVIKTYINGVKAAEIHDSQDLCGFIGLQLHLTHNNGPRAVKPGAKVQWRNIKIKSIE